MNDKSSVSIPEPIVQLQRQLDQFRMFILGTSTVVAYAPVSSIDFIAPIPQTMRAALGLTGVGNLIAMTAIFLIELRLLGAASMIFTGATRLPMTAGWDDLVPGWFTRLHPRWRTPVNSIACMAVLVFLLLVLATAGVHAQEAYQLLSNASITHYEIAYLAMFAGLWWAARHCAGSCHCRSSSLRLQAGFQRCSACSFRLIRSSM